MKNDKKMIMVKSANTFQTVTKWWTWMRKIRQNDEHMKKEHSHENWRDTWWNVINQTKKTCDKVMKIEENHDEMWQEQYQNYYKIINKTTGSKWWQIQVKAMAGSWNLREHN